MKQFSALLLVLFFGALSFTAEAAQPNILFILTDDQGWPTLGSYGGDVVPTPNLDRLAAEGARFTAAYVTPLCTPTRAALLSGQYTARSGMFHVLIDPWYGSPFAPMEELPYLAQYPSDGFTIAKSLNSAAIPRSGIPKHRLATRDTAAPKERPTSTPGQAPDTNAPSLLRTRPFDFDSVPHVAPPAPRRRYRS